MANEKFYKKWTAKGVRVASGPFTGARGTVQTTYAPNVQVTLIGKNASTLWFRADDLVIE